MTWSRPCCAVTRSSPACATRPACGSPDRPCFGLGAGLGPLGRPITAPFGPSCIAMAVTLALTIRQSRPARDGIRQRLQPGWVTMKNFADKVAVITGAGSGIGRALAKDLAGAGAKLALSDIDEAGLEETVNQLNMG